MEVSGLFYLTCLCVPDLDAGTSPQEVYGRGVVEKQMSLYLLGTIYAALTHCVWKRQHEGLTSSSPAEACPGALGMGLGRLRMCVSIELGTVSRGMNLVCILMWAHCYGMQMSAVCESVCPSKENCQGVRYG